MKQREEVIQELVEQWLKKAKEDLAVVRLIIRHDEPLYASVGFHAQQAVEKLLKAFLTRHQVEFAKSHDIGLLLDLVGKVDASLSKSLDDVRNLSPFAVESRYPGDSFPLGQKDIQNLLVLAEKCREHILESLG